MSVYLARPYPQGDRQALTLLHHYERLRRRPYLKTLDPLAVDKVGILNTAVDLRDRFDISYQVERNERMCGIVCSQPVRVLLPRGRSGHLNSYHYESRLTRRDDLIKVKVSPP